MRDLVNNQNQAFRDLQTEQDRRHQEELMGQSRLHGSPMEEQTRG